MRALARETSVGRSFQTHRCVRRVLRWLHRHWFGMIVRESNTDVTEPDLWVSHQSWSQWNSCDDQASGGTGNSGVQALLQTAASQSEMAPPCRFLLPVSRSFLARPFPITSDGGAASHTGKLFIKSNSRCIHLSDGFPACFPQHRTACTLKLENSHLLTSAASSWPCGCTAAGPIFLRKTKVEKSHGEKCGHAS